MEAISWKRGENESDASPVGRRRRIPARKRLQLLVLLLGIVGSGYAAMSCSSTVNKPKVVNTETEQTNKKKSEALVEIDPNTDFSTFKHKNPEHERLPCLYCHQQDSAKTAALKFPVHQNCAGCHVEQFADGAKQIGAKQICGICHSEGSRLKGFPGLKTHNVKFDHGKHAGKTSCVTCHRQSSKGVAMTVVTGRNAHTTCFSCHQPDSGAEAGGLNARFCASCHQPGTPERAVYVAKAFKFSFTHANHKSVSCANCHKVRPGAVRGKQVSVITTAMHFPPNRAQSCASCHNNKRVFGGDDFADCKRCHTGRDFRF